MFIYYIVDNFKNHVTSLITTTRKIFTVLISIVVFGHVLTTMQYVGMVIVFLGVFL
jgi:UDP-galactose transporter B1